MRELDWRIHEYMGNDLTGWEWEHDPLSSECALRVGDIDLEIIPHYSTTWEGAGLVMECLWSKGYIVKILLQPHTKEVYVTLMEPDEYSRTYKYAASVSQAICNAFISAMEERNNG